MSKHWDYCLASAELTIAEPSAGITARDHMIYQLTRYLSKAETRHTTVRGVAAGYFRQLQEATIPLFNGNSHAPGVIRRTISSQQQVIRQQKDLLVVTVSSVRWI